MGKGRKRKPRTYKKRVLILCEGETESIYFRGLKASETFRMKGAIDVQIKSPGKDALNLVKEANKAQTNARKEQNPFDQVWVVFDKDQYNKHQQAFELAFRKNIGIAFSSISFEVWFLLHFERTRRAFLSSREVIDHLKASHLPDFKKTGQDHFKRTRDATQKGIANAQWLREQKALDRERENGAIYNLNPYITVDELVSALCEL